MSKWTGLERITAEAAEAELEHERLNWTPPQPSAATVALFKRIGLIKRANVGSVKQTITDLKS